ncbi:MAG: hypothetical protein HY777_16720 [Betaproteobacteria bacterium]|nr:hypothetical protein [Betaproteobacteria bacterium]
MRHKPRNESVRLPACRLFLAGYAAFGLSSPAHAVCTPTATAACLANQPIQSVTTLVKPNVMVLLDNSGSMSWDFMPDSAYVGTSSNCRMNSRFNTIYYNPNFNYTASRPTTAYVYPNYVNPTQMANQPFTRAAVDPFHPYIQHLNANYRDLSGNNFCAMGGTTALVPQSNGSYGTCSTGSATTNQNAQPAYYYRWNGAGNPATCLANGNYTKVVVGATSCDGQTPLAPGETTKCPTGADERQNFANWYSYFRTRMWMMKSSLATAFAPLDDKFRVGLYPINKLTYYSTVLPPSGSTYQWRASQNIGDFSAGVSGGEPANTLKGDWYFKLFKVASGGSTPTRTALRDMGKYYSGNAVADLSGDPLQYSCQKNFTILATDGYWNGADPSVGDGDKNVPATMPIKQGNSVYIPGDTGLTPSAQFPRPYYEGSSSSSNSMADVAMYYWINDLRTSGSVSANNVPATANDPAYWQHMNTFTLGLGVSGTLAFPDDLAALQSGAKNWPVPAADSPKAIDDLWHAAINGRGQYYKATNPATLASGLASALKAVTDAPTYGVGPSSSTSDFKSPDQDDYTTYATSYRIINWSGDVKKYAVDRTTGMKTGTPLWSAAKQLDMMVNPGLTSAVSPTAYQNRKIVTRTEAGAAVDFTYATLSADQKTALCYKLSPGTGACVAGDSSLVDYLRGDATYEGDYGIGIARFRNRRDATEANYYKRDLLGSIVNAGPAYVATEKFSYQESSDPGYDAFKTSKKNRAPTLYVPANDGMVHALDASTSPTGGNEIWAYVPSFVIRTGNDENGKEKGLRALSYQDSGAPPYNQHYYVDATPEVGSVDFARTGGPVTPSSPSGNWRTILVGGLGKGGRGYYALDVTTPATGADAKTKVLWEFPGANDIVNKARMGYSYGRPIIAKTYGYGWVVILPSGYNNDDGYGYVFVLDAQTGALKETLQTTTTAPGMAHITTLVKFNNKYVTQVYGGDLSGNVWRFDFGSPALSPRVSQIFSSSSSTPIASEVTVAVDGNDGSRWVFFGTGQYLDVPDRATTGTQYLVALRDGSAGAPRTTPAGAVALSSLTAVSSLIGGVASAPSGWKYALPTSGERIASKPLADLRTVVFASLIPTTDPCSPGIASYIYGLEYSTGASRLKEGGTTIASKYMSTGTSGLSFQTTGKTASSSGTPQLVGFTPEGQAISLGLDTSKIYSGTRHVGWRELLNEY